MSNNNLNWTITYKTVFGEKKVESFKDKKEATARYESLLARTYGSLGDIAGVTKPIQSGAKVSEAKDGFDWDAFSDVLRRRVVGMEDNPRNDKFIVDNWVVRDGDLKTPLVRFGFDADNAYFSNVTLSEEDYDKAFGYFKQATEDVLAGLMAPDEINYVKKPYTREDSTYEECGGSSAASLGATPTAVVRPDNESKKSEATGDAGIATQMISALRKKAEEDREWFGKFNEMYAKELEEVGLSGITMVFRPKDPYQVEDRFQYNVEWQPYDLNYDYVKNEEFNKKTYGFIDSEWDGKSVVTHDYRPLDDQSIDDFYDIVVGSGSGDEGIFLWVLEQYNQSIGKTESKKSEADGDEDKLQAAYGDGGIITHESSADGFYVDDHDPMGYAILNNDVATMKELFAGTAPVPEKPWTYAGWYEDIDAPEDKDGNYPYVYDWERENDTNFVNDWKRVVGKTNNEEALNLLLEKAPDFVPAAIDFYNAFHAGYDKKLLRKLLDNISVVIDPEDINNDYLHYEEFGEDAYGNLDKFLGASESCKSEALPPKQWGDRARKFPSRAALVNKAKTLGATEITSHADYKQLNDDVFLDKIGFAMDVNGNCKARLWWGEKDGKYYYSITRDVLDRTI